ncbi:MAG: RHS repeat protein, partial [Hyphomicrobiales bacterium]
MRFNLLRLVTLLIPTMVLSGASIGLHPSGERPTLSVTLAAPSYAGAVEIAPSQVVSLGPEYDPATGGCGVRGGNATYGNVAYCGNDKGGGICYFAPPPAVVAAQKLSEDSVHYQVMCNNVANDRTEPFGLGYAKNQNNRPDNPVTHPCCEGDPIEASTGATIETETDFTGGPFTRLSLRRLYNSNFARRPDAQFSFGNWISNWEAKISTLSLIPPSAPNNMGVTYITVFRPSGGKFLFIRGTNGAITTDPDVRLSLSPVMNSSTQIGWRLLTDDDSVENYDVGGKLTSITDRGGGTTTLAYDANSQLVSVTGPFGHKLTFTFDASHRVTQMAAPDGGVYAYTYDAHGNLATVIYPGAVRHRYVYENTGFPKALTGIFDEKGTRFSTWAYDSYGYAISSSLAGGIDLTTVSYSPGSSTTVTDARGNIHTYSLASQNGVLKPTDLSGAPVQTSGGRSFTYDSSGFIASRTDWNGNVTTSTHDPRGNETSRTEASGTPLARTIATAWHPALHLPVKVTQPGRVTDFTYDSKGNLLSKKITAGTQTRTWSYTYSALGQKLTETNPLGKVTTFAYDAQGNLASIKNALGQITQFTNYDSAGRLLRSVDPNGLVTTFTYDLRGRLTSKSEGALKTSFAYDAVGNLIKVIKPDNSFLTFTYDPAHRLITVADALGNRIAYTLDAASNKTAEAVFTPANVQVRSKTFTYDNVNRVLTAVGVSGPSNSYAYDSEGDR